MYTEHTTPTGWQIESFRTASGRYRVNVRNPDSVIVLAMNYGPYEGARVEQVVNAMVAMSGASAKAFKLKVA